MGTTHFAPQVFSGCDRPWHCAVLGLTARCPSRWSPSVLTHCGTPKRHQRRSPIQKRPLQIVICVCIDRPLDSMAPVSFLEHPGLLQALRWSNSALLASGGDAGVRTFKGFSFGLRGSKVSPCTCARTKSTQEAFAFGTSGAPNSSGFGAAMAQH